MDKIRNIYNNLWQDALVQFTANTWQVDPYFDEQQDHRRGLTLLARLSPDVASRVSDFLSALRKIEPNQYFYPESDFHLTILSIISCYDGFQHNPQLDEAYIATIRECLNELPSPNIHFQGITASPACVMVQGFPSDDNLQILRDRLRNRFQDSHLPTAIDARYPLITAHLTILRFQSDPDNLPAFIEMLQKYRQYNFGRQSLQQLQFVTNGWYLKHSATKILHNFTLSD